MGLSDYEYARHLMIRWGFHVFHDSGEDREKTQEIIEGGIAGLEYAKACLNGPRLLIDNASKDETVYPPCDVA